MFVLWPCLKCIFLEVLHIALVHKKMCNGNICIYLFFTLMERTLCKLIKVHFLWDVWCGQLENIQQKKKLNFSLFFLGGTIKGLKVLGLI